MLLPLLMNLGMFGQAPGGLGGSKKRKKAGTRLYLERDGQILLFSSKQQVEAYLEAEAQVDYADGFKPKKRRFKPKVLDAEVLKSGLPEESRRIDYLFEIKAVDELLLIQSKILDMGIKRYLRMIEDENDIEILLLSM